MNRPLILIGAGGHAKVLLDVIEQNNLILGGVCDPRFYGESIDSWYGVKVLGDDEAIYRYKPDEVLLVNGLGSLPGDSRARNKVYNLFKKMNYEFATLVHPSAVVSAYAKLAEGVQVMAGSILQSGAKIKNNTIINTGVIIEHDSIVGENCHVAPRAVVCGGVNIGENTHVGVGASIVQSVSIGKHCVVGSGTTVLKNIFDEHRLLGASAKCQELISQKK